MPSHELLDQPTRGTITQLFRELQEPPYYDYQNSGYKTLHDELKELEKRLLNVRIYRELKKRADASEKEHRLIKLAVDAEVRRVKNRYLAHGLTPKVRKEIEQLVEYVHQQRGIMRGNRGKVRKNPRREKGNSRG